MTEQLAIIDRLMSEHHLIRNNIKLIGDSVSDIEALFGLRNAHAGWAQSSVEDLESKKLQLQQALSGIEEGLINHFTYEEKVVPPFFGDILTKALILEHREISKQIEMARAIVTNANLKELNQEDKLLLKSRLQQSIGVVCQSVEQHAALEEQILTILKKTLESEAEQPKQV